MSLPKEKEESLYSAHIVMKDFLKPSDPMQMFSKELFPIFNDESFEDCYSDVGRNGRSPSFLAMVTLLQWKESLSDDETVKAVNTRLDWKIALHLEVAAKDIFEASTLCVFRKRLIENDKMCIIFDTLLNQIKKKGFIRDHAKQRIDATHVVKHLNRISTTDLLYRAVKWVVIEIGKADPEYYNKIIPDDIQERYSKDFSSFGLSKEKRGDRQAEIVEDGFRIKRIIQDNPAETLKELKQLVIMETIFSENVIIRIKEVGDKEFIEVEEIVTPKQTIFTPDDPTLKLGKKGKTSWVGEKWHVVETAEKGEVNFIVGMIQQAANENDNKILPKLKEMNDEMGLKPDKTYADTNYISRTAIMEFEERGERLMGYVQKDTSAKPEGFKLEDFKIDMDTLTAICPKGIKSEKHIKNGGSNHSIIFPKNECMVCSFFKDCVTGKQKKRVLVVGKGYGYFRKRRDEQKTAEFKSEMSVRAQVEGTISESVRFHGLRKIKYKGTEGRQFQYLMTGAAVNFKRYIKKLLSLQQKLPISEGALA